jgi:hypothetical protein
MKSGIWHSFILFQPANLPFFLLLLQENHTTSKAWVGFAPIFHFSIVAPVAVGGRIVSFFSRRSGISANASTFHHSIIPFFHPSILHPQCVNDVTLS